jgi:DNA-binding NarL/FixJ family response regulator
MSPSIIRLPPLEATHRQFALPADGGPPQSADAPSGDASPRPGEGKRVLIVEDEALIAMDMEMALSQAGFEVVATVDTEADAIAACERLEPDVVLMDITLREGNGIMAAGAIMRSSPARVIFVSGNSDPKTLAAARALAGAGFIRKPFGDNLALLVAAALAPLSDH